jgi:hypothetical protein
MFKFRFHRWFLFQYLRYERCNKGTCKDCGFTLDFAWFQIEYTKKSNGVKKLCKN